jgi:large subunit ribosomal protein L13
MTTTYIPKKDDLERKWYVIDAKDQVLGKLAATAAEILTGKRKAVYTPFLDTGDHVIIVNAAQVHLTGKKREGKVYRSHSGYMGGLKSLRAEDVLRRNPARLVEEAVWGMLPKTKLGRSMFGKLKVYAGQKHPHQAQRPQAMAVRRAR